MLIPQKDSRRPLRRAALEGKVGTSSYFKKAGGNSSPRPFGALGLITSPPIGECRMRTMTKEQITKVTRMEGGEHSPRTSGAGASKTPLTAKEVRAMNFWSICKRFDASMGMGLSKKSPTKKSDVNSPSRKMMERGGQHCSWVMLCYDVKEKKMRGEGGRAVRL